MWQSELIKIFIVSYNKQNLEFMFNIINSLSESGIMSRCKAVPNDKQDPLSTHKSKDSRVHKNMNDNKMK